MLVGSRGYKKKLYVMRLSILIILMIIVGLSYCLWEILKSERIAVMERDKLKLEHANLLDQYQSLIEEVSYLSSEESREAELRESFNVAKEGEQIVIISGAEDQLYTLTDTKNTTSVENIRY